VAKKLKWLERLSKSNWWPPLLSALVIPGTGQIYNREYGKGLILATAFISGFVWFSKAVTEKVSLILAMPPEKWQQDPAALREALMGIASKSPQLFLTFYALMILVWVFSIVDAYISARNLKTMPPPVERTDEDIDTDR
jgi:hypothetical protein